jgi:hypothetical protein
LARVAAIDSKAINLARRNFIIYVIWLEHCRRIRLSPEQMLKFICNEELGILKELGVRKVDEALLTCKRIESNVVSEIPPELILKCLIGEVRLNLLSSVIHIKKRHFTIFSTHRKLAKPDILDAFENEKYVVSSQKRLRNQLAAGPT